MQAARPPSQERLTGVFWWHQVLDKMQMVVNAQSTVSHNTLYSKAQPEQEQGLD